MAGFVALGIAIALLVKGLYPAGLPESHGPDFVDNIFDNRGVLWAARLLLVSAAGVLAFGGSFIVLSIGMRMKNREWLKRAGPFEISEAALSQNAADAAFWRQLALEHREETGVLRRHLDQAAETIENLRNDS